MKIALLTVICINPLITFLTYFQLLLQRKWQRNCANACNKNFKSVLESDLKSQSLYFEQKWSQVIPKLT